MNAIKRMQEANARAIFALNAEIQRVASLTEHREVKIKAVSNFTPGTVLAWFFTWTICVVGFMAAMTVLTTLGKLAKILVP